MAANRFATMLHRNTNKITMILVYAALEWVLILLLLVNSLFGYFITKFADYFGLKHPCLWCSRVDHVLDHGKSVNSIAVNSVCDRHASEISELGYCHHHRKLAKSQEMCDNCSSSMVLEEETVLSCSCCNERLEEKVFPSRLLLKPSWCNTEGANREVESDGAKKCDSSLGTEDHTDEGAADVEDEHQIISDLDSFSIREVTSEEECSKSLSNFRWRDKESSGDAKEASHGMEVMRESCGSSNLTRISLVEDSSIEVIDLQCMRYDSPCDCSDRLELIDLVYSSMNENGKLPNFREEEQHAGVSQVDVVAHLYHNNSEPETKKESDEHLPASNGEETAKDEEMEHLEAPCALATSGKGSDDSDGEPDRSQFQEDLPPANGDGSEVPDPERHEETAEKPESKDTIQTLNFEAEAEEEKFPNTPTSLESLQNWQKKLLLSERRDSSIEDSWDGSVLSEIMDGADGALTIERLKSALTAERKALRALYAELEEERSASAIAANHTMAMITRLQEEKAAMQMEALQYQRMMEEQSEYDQEALQLLNELMVKREKEKQELEEEKQELERELENYREKVSEYEAKERLRNESPVQDSDNDDDELSIDLNRELGDQCRNEEINTPSDDIVDLEELAIDCVKNMNELDDSLAEFEEERLSILNQLKSLEEKLLTMSSEGESLQLHNAEKDEESPSFFEDGSMRKMAKRLLPLLDAAEDEPEEAGIGPENAGMLEAPTSETEEGEREAKRADIVQEVDQVYERLQALEEDQEFLNHCIGSVKKGDEGMNLLHEIPQHLRDLKNVELRVRNIQGE